MCVFVFVRKPHICRQRVCARNPQRTQHNTTIISERVQIPLSARAHCRPNGNLDTRAHYYDDVVDDDDR